MNEDTSSFTDTAKVEGNLQARLDAAQTPEEREHWERQIAMHSIIMSFVEFAQEYAKTFDDAPVRGGRQTIRLDPQPQDRDTDE